MKKLRTRWRKLDNSAKIFPMISNKKFTSVYRISAVLKEDIDENILSKAVENVLNKQVSFKVKLRRGFFWYYFEANNKKIKVEKENNYPCKLIDKNENNGYLFKVTYYNSKINLDVFHSLTDGSTATNFLKEIVYEYIDLKTNKKVADRSEDHFLTNNVEDSYLKNYDKKKAKNEKAKNAYSIHGKNLPLYAFGVIHEFINLEQFKELAKENGATITEYFVAILAYAIYKEDFIYHKSKKPIRICIPVNLKKYFESNTSTNFFSYMNIELKLSHKEEYSFKDILALVLNEFDERFTHEEIEKIMASNIKLGVNPVIRGIPLIIKNIAVSLSYINVRNHLTTTFSNVGKIELKEEYANYVDSFLFLLSPDNIGRIKFSAISYENKLVFSSISLLNDYKIEKAVYEFLKEKNIEINMESNGVYGTIS